MGVFNLDRSNCEVSASACSSRTKDECIIALKVYDSCRQQDCLDSDILGPARAASAQTYCNIQVAEGEIISPPTNAAGITIDNLTLNNVVIVSKKVNPFRNGYWDVDLKYVFNYTLIFRDVSADEMCSVAARSVYNKKVTLFGSISTDSIIATDWLASDNVNSGLKADPFVFVDAKAVALSAELRYVPCCGDEESNAQDVVVTIGLFTIVKLFRLVDLVVDSKGFCIPEQCEDVSALSPCEYFDSLDFPMDLFAPPQRPEFEAGISSNIPANKTQGSSCGCGCGCNSCNSCSNN